MNPCVTRGGHSFRGSFLYYMHDKGNDTRDRIAWTHTENMLTCDPDLAWKVMAYTAKSQDRLKQASGVSSAGRKCEKPVMAYSLSWHPEQNPDKDHMLDTALASIKVLGLSEHECLIVAHRDTPHKHVHVVVNRIHPITGLVASNSHSYRKLSGFALEYSREHGLDYSPQREENARKRDISGSSKYRDNRIQEAWEKSDTGRSLIAALESQGLTLANGNKRLVLVDPTGKTVNPVRHIKGIRNRDFRERLSDIDLSNLPTVDEAIERKKIRPKRDKSSAKRFQDHIKRINEKYRLDEQKRTIRDLEKKLSTAPWWRKFFRLTRKDKRELSHLLYEFIKARHVADQEIKKLKKNHQKTIQRQHLRYSEQIWEKSVPKSQILRSKEPISLSSKKLIFFDYSR